LSGYRWVIVGASIVGLSVSVSPIFLNTIPVFLKAIAADTNWSRTQIVAGLSVATLAITFASPVIGRLIDAFGPRRVIAYSTAPFALSLAAMRYLDASYAGYLALAALVGALGNCVNTFVYLSFMPRWFVNRLGLSLGLAATGIGVGQTIDPLAASYLLARYGWRDAFVILGVATLTVTLICVAVLRDGPLDARLPQVRTAQAATYGLDLEDAMRTVVFWRLLVSVFLATAAVTGCTLSMVPLLTDRGLSLDVAAGMAATAGLAVILGRFATGLVLDRLGATAIARAMFVVAAGAIAALALGEGRATLYVAVAVIGLALGGEGDVLAFAVRSAFGTRAYGRIYGLLFGAFNAGVLIGPILMGLSFDRLGSYRPMLTALGVCAIVAAICFPRTSFPEAAAPAARDPDLLSQEARSGHV